MFLACTCVYVTSLELNDFRTPAWKDGSLETVFDLYSSTTDCDQTDSNSSCAKVRKDNNNASFHFKL